jgi:hypothetical protein
MALEHPPDQIRFMFRIKMQHHSCDFAPVRTFRICVEQAQIRDEVLLLVRGQHGIGGRNIGDIGIKRWRLRGRSRNRLLIDLTLLWTPWHMMTSTGEVRFAPMNGRRQLEPSGPKSANNRIGVRSLLPCYLVLFKSPD